MNTIEGFGPLLTATHSLSSLVRRDRLFELNTCYYDIGVIKVIY